MSGHLLSGDSLDVSPFSPLKVNRCFGGTFSLHLQGRRKKQARNQPERKFFDLEDGCEIFLRNIC
jgi:hypothetical protein